MFTLKTDISANKFHKPSLEQKAYSLLQLKQVKRLCCHGNFIHNHALVLLDYS